MKLWTLSNKNLQHSLDAGMFTVIFLRSILNIHYISDEEAVGVTAHRDSTGPAEPLLRTTELPRWPPLISL